MSGRGYSLTASKAKADRELWDSLRSQVGVEPKAPFPVLSLDGRIRTEEPGQNLILFAFRLVALLTGVARYYFSLFRPRRPTVVALVLLAAFIF